MCIFSILLLVSCGTNEPAKLKNGETYTYYGGMELTVEKGDTYQRENFGEIYTFTAIKLRYENKSNRNIITLTDFQIEDENGKINKNREPLPSGYRWNINVKEIEPAEYSPGSVAEGYVVFKGDARSITLTDNWHKDLATWTFI